MLHDILIGSRIYFNSYIQYCPKTPMYCMPSREKRKRQIFQKAAKNATEDLQNMRIVPEEMETGAADQNGWRAIIGKTALQHRQI